MAFRVSTSALGCRLKGGRCLRSYWHRGAAQTGRTKAYYLRELIEQGLEDMEDYYLAAEVLERVRKGQEPVHSAADVRTDLGLDD